MNKAEISTVNKIARSLWSVTYLLLFRFTPTSAFRWRALVLNLMGGQIHSTAKVYPSVKIWAPWNLVMGPQSCMASKVDCYNVARVSLGAKSLVSQGSTLCTASHDYNSAAFELMIAGIEIRERAWVTMECFVGPGVTMDVGSVALARSVVTKNCESWAVYAGSPAKAIKSRAKNN